MKDLDTNTKLEIYGLGKQGAKGDNTTEAPFFLDIKESLKWKAWTEKKGMSMEDAQDQFMTLMKALGFYQKLPPGECARLTICLADNVTPNPNYVPTLML